MLAHAQSCRSGCPTFGNICEKLYSSYRGLFTRVVSQLQSERGQSRPTATLLQTSDFGTADTDVCMDMLTEAADERNVLAVLLTGTVDSWLTRWRAIGNERPASLGFVTTGELFRSTTAQNNGGERTSIGGGTALRSVSNPGDLTGLQIAIGEFLDDWADSEAETVVCIDSVTVLLQYVDRSAAYRFLHTLLGRAWSADASVHAHLDPATVDGQELATFVPLFDTVVSETD